MPIRVNQADPEKKVMTHKRDKLFYEKFHESCWGVYQKNEKVHE